MSTVRMCDKCSTIFSELEDGWQRYQATTVVYDENGSPQQINQNMDACPSCAVVPAHRSQKMSETDRKIQALERENKALDAKISDALKSDAPLAS